MSNDENHDARERLLRLQAQLINEAADSPEADIELDPARVGRLSRMDAMQDQAMARATADRRDARIAGVAAALERMENGDYGLCRRCESAIHPRRLDVDPLALLCIDCASLSET